MRRFLTPPLALLAGLALLLSACSGESPTAPTPPGGGNGGGGACNVSITLNASSVTPKAGSGVIVRATVRRDGTAVPDGTSVLFTTDLGFFLETGLPTVSKVTVGGFADVTLASLSAGTSHIKAILECATAPLAIEFEAVPTDRPFISSIFPTSGSCTGGDLVTINGGKFGTSAATTGVTFGGAPATIVSVTDTQIVVRTPARTLANPLNPEQVDIVVVLNTGTAGTTTLTLTKGYTYFCVDKRIFISSVVPNSGSPQGGETVVINGGNFGTTIATTRVTFCGVSATIINQTNNAITVLTPRHLLANPLISETCDVGVTIDLGLVSQQSAVLPQAFTYRGTGTGGACNTDPGTFISTVNPNTGAPNGGDTIAISGGGFGTNLATTRVEFGGVAAQIVSVTPSLVTITTPRHVLANPNVSESVDVTVTRDVGGQNQTCARVTNGFTYRGGAPGECATNASVFIATLTPNTGGPEGGTNITITGAGFGSSLPTTRVEFGGVPGQVIAVSPNSITVTTPRRTLTNPDVPETVPVRVVVDAGGANQVCATLTNGFTFTRVALQPTIFSVSPRTGPNDASTRVTIFGNNFQFPMQVFVSTGACGGALIEATVVSIRLDEIVFLTPIALNGNSCLANAAVDITVINPTTGLKATCAECFKYYPCPRITSAGPNFGSYLGGDRIVINGENFEEPVNVGGGGFAWQPVSVSSSSIVALTSRPLLNGCADLTGAITVGSDALPGCPLAIGPNFTYLVAGLTPKVFTVSPAEIAQGGEIITITGQNFFDPMQIIFTVGTETRTVTPTSLTSTTMVVAAPAFAGTFRTEVCTTEDGQPGTRRLPTAVTFTVKNAVTTCVTTAQVVYRPDDASCRPNVVVGPLVITTNSLPAGTICTAYPLFKVTASGGTQPYQFSSTGLPNGLILDPASGTISGTPGLPASGAGGSTTSSVVITVTDASPTPKTTTKTLDLLLVDPNGPFVVSGPSPQNIAGNGGDGATLLANPNPTPTGFTPITWTIDSISPFPAAGVIGFADPGNPTNILPTVQGQSAHLRVSGAVPQGSYDVIVRATDSACGTFKHTDTLVVTINKQAALTLSPASAPNGTLCVPFGAFSFTAAGGTGGPYTFAVASGTLPAGLNLNPSTGALTGTPVLAAAGTGGDTTSNFGISVNDGIATVIKTYAITITDPNGPFVITGASTQNIPGTGGVTSNLTANPNPTPAGYTPITWSIDSINPVPASGTITASSPGQTSALTVSSDVPAGSYVVTVRATDASCGTFHHTATFAMTVNKAVNAVIITNPDTLTLPAATLCVPYTGPGTTLTATGGTPPYTWTVTGGTLPPGLSLNVIGQTAQITGIPTLPITGQGGNQTYNITFTATDSSAIPISGSRTYNLGVEDPDGPFVIVGNGAQSFPLGAITDGSTLFAMVNKSSPVIPTWTPIYWSLTSAPAGITIVGSDGGFPTSGLTAHLHTDGTLAAGQYNVTVRAEDSPPCLSPSNPGVHHQADFTVILTIVGP